MSTVYYRVSDGLYALAGDSPGTSANWQEATDPKVYNKWVVQRNNANVPLTDAEFAAKKVQYLEPLRIAGGGGTVPAGLSTKADVDAAAAKVIAEVPPKSGAAARAAIVK